MKKTRKAAIAALEKHYHTGKPCKYGHIAKRNTADGCCVTCRYESGVKQAVQNKKIRALINEANHQS